MEAWDGSPKAAEGCYFPRELPLNQPLKSVPRKQNKNTDTRTHMYTHATILGESHDWDCVVLIIGLNIIDQAVVDSPIFL